MNLAFRYAAAIFFLLTAAAANSARMTAIYSGNIASGTDYAGVFGLAGQDLTGQAFIAKFNYDTSLGDREIGPTYDIIGGGQLVYLPHPVTSTSLHINTSFIMAYAENTYALVSAAGTASDNILGSDTNTIHYISFYRKESDGFVYREAISIDSQIDPGISSLEMRVSTRPTQIRRGAFEFYKVPRFGNEDDVVLLAEGTFGGIGTYAVVPEPAAWLLMISGFGLSGIFIRRRRNICTVTN